MFCIGREFGLVRRPVVVFGINCQREIHKPRAIFEYLVDDSKVRQYILCTSIDLFGILRRRSPDCKVQFSE